MRTHPVLLSLGAGLRAVTVTACASGAKTSASQATSSSITAPATSFQASASSHLIAVQGAGGLLSGKYSGAVAVAKAVIAGLH